MYTDCLEKRMDDRWLDDRDTAVLVYLQIYYLFHISFSHVLVIYTMLDL